ncbi:MAG: SsrA-binding protein SmpB [Nitrospina sp.]|nr:SsrA-binding protein SmpB [Nitrospina sp.]
MEGIKIICQNKKARHEYHLEDRFEAGIVLVGTEVKALRDGRASMVDSFAEFESGEAYLYNCHINHYTPAHQFNHNPTRKRKLLLHKAEIGRLIGKTREKGISLIPLKLYFKKGKVKVELALAHGKKLHDKRESLKRKEAEREMSRAIKSFNR